MSPDLQSDFASENRAFEAAYQRGDAVAVAAMLTADVIISPSDMADLQGRSAVRSLLSQFFEANEVVTYQLTSAELEVHGDTAYERGTFVWASRPKGQAVKTEPGRYSLVRHRDKSGVWRIHRFLENRSSRPL